MFSNILLAAGTGSSTWIMLGVLGGLMIIMVLMSVIPQKKRQKKAQAMMDSIHVGSKIKTIGGFIGEVKVVDNTTNSFVIDISAKTDGSTLVTIDRSAIYTVLQPTQEGTLEPVAPTIDASADDLEIENERKSKKNKKGGDDFETIDNEVEEKSDEDSL